MLMRFGVSATKSHGPTRRTANIATKADRPAHRTGSDGNEMNRKARTLIAVLSAIVLATAGVLARTFTHQLFGPHPNVIYLPPSEWRFERSRYVLLNGTTVAGYRESFKCGPLSVQVEKPVTHSLLIYLHKLTGKTYHKAP
jgi:hypothetical protein